MDISTGIFVIIQLIKITGSRKGLIRSLKNDKESVIEFMNPIRLERSDYRAFAPVFIIAILSAAYNALKVCQNWRSATGAEYEYVAKAIANGHGFSFPANHRWLFIHFTELDPSQYFPTAWEEPIIPYFLGTNFYLFGEYGKLSFLMSNVLFYFLTAIVLFWAAKVFHGYLAGYVSVFTFLLLPHHNALTTRYLGNSIFAALLILLSSVIACWYLKDVTWKKSIPTGLYFGFMALTHAGTLLFAPALSLYTIISSTDRHKAFISAILLSLFTLIAISPWTIRNYLVFGEVVPVRNGVGQILYVSNAALGHTLKPHALEPAKVRAPWTSNNLWHSWKQMMNNKKRGALEKYAEIKIAAETGIEYMTTNEAGRDKFLLTAAKQYILQNPLATLYLSSVKAVHFFFLSWPQYIWKIPMGAIITFIAGIGALLFFKRREVSVLLVFILSYAIPYMVTAPYFYRYRYPVEPLIIILFSLTIASIKDKLLHES